MQVYLFLLAAVPLLAIQHCCKKKTVNGVEYNLLKVSDGDMHLDFHCLNNCVYGGPDHSTNFCFAPGNYQPTCLVASEADSEAKETLESIIGGGADYMAKRVEAMYKKKTDEYGNMEPTTLSKKLDHIMKHMYFPGDPFYKHSISNKNYLNAVPSQHQQRYKKMDDKFDKYITEMMDHLKNDPRYINQALDKMLPQMLDHAQNEPAMQQAAHFGVRAARLAFKLMQNDTEGSSPLDRMILAIMNNTSSSRQGLLSPLFGALGSLAKSVVGGAATGGLAGSAAGGVGAVPGAIAGATGGLAMGTGGVLTEIEKVAGSILGCFSPTSQVETRSGLKALKEVAIGDFIRTSSRGRETSFTEFLGWMDRQESSPVQMLQVWTSQNLSPLTLTGSHIVFTQTSTKYADELLPGDTLLHWNGTSMHEQQVTQVLTTLEFGFWAPLTTDGTLLVDGYLTSCYASFPHQLSDIAMNPVKILPSILLDNEESQHKDGVRGVIQIIKKVGDLLGTRKQKRTYHGHFPIVGENIVASFMDKSEF